MTGSPISKRFLILFALLAIMLLSITAVRSADAGFEYGVHSYLAKDYDAALKAWKPLADEGHAPAQFGMGLSYENGRGVERDPAQAAIWYRKAAEQNLADAQFNLGNLYLNALGMPKNSVEAVRWFRRAAEQGMPQAQVNLGYSYETGSGVTKDPVKAVTWYRRAAAQNFPHAQYYLGAAYERGSGVKANLPVAAGWYQLAAYQGVVLAAKRLDNLMRDGVKPAVTADATPQEFRPTGSEAPTTEPETPALAENTPPRNSPAAGAAEETNSTQKSPTPTKIPGKVVPPWEETFETRVNPTALEEAEIPLAEKSKSDLLETEPAPATDRAGARVTTMEGNYRVRLASYRNPENANKGWLILVNKHSDLIANFNYAIAEVNLGVEQGIYHRLEAGPAGTFDEAKVICTRIKSRGDSCVVVRP